MNWEKYEQDVREWLCKSGITIPVTFFEDGILNADTHSYACSNFRPLFLFREVHDNESQNNRKRLRELEEVKNASNLWKKVAELIIRARKELSNDPITIEDENPLQKAAVVNLKKVSGGTYSNGNKSIGSLSYELHAKMFRENIEKQIVAINPNIIFCGGTFSDLKKYGFGVTELKVSEDYSQANLRCMRKAYTGALAGNPIKVIDMWHPSASISYDDFSTGVGLLGKG